MTTNQAIPHPLRHARLINALLPGTILAACLLSGPTAIGQVSQGTEFSYQGQLKYSGEALSDTADFEFKLWDAETGGGMIGSVVAVDNVLVENGFFTVELDFGALAFTGGSRWLEICVRSPAGAGAFTTLDPRQPLSATPYALSVRGLHTVASNNPAYPGSWNVIGGYSGNNVAVDIAGATIAGGGFGSLGNSVTARFGTVGGGYGNTAAGVDSTVSGGSQNDATGTFSTVSGGGANNAIGLRSTVAGGYGNTADGSQATIGGGSDNNAAGQHAVIGGGSQNMAAGTRSTIGGGILNIADANQATVGGGIGNSANGIDSTVGGGNDNIAGGESSTVAGGEVNIAMGDWAFIGGGFLNQSLTRSSIGGGVGNFASGQEATIAGGEGNSVSGNHSTIGGGFANLASGLASSIAGGFNNVASGAHSAIPGGNLCQAGGSYSFAAGRRAIVRNAASAGNTDGDAGTFVWADSNNSDFPSTGPNQFLIRAVGGVGIGTNNPDNQLSVAGNADFSGNGSDAVVIENISSGRGLRAVAPEDTAVWAITDTGFAGVHGRNAAATGRAIYGEATHVTGTNVGVYGRSNSPNGYDFYAGGAGVNYGASSSQRWKNNIEPIGDPLQKLAQLRGVYFNWDEQHGGARDIGMIAEEVGKVLPEVVVFEENGIDASGMDYSKMAPLLVEAVNALRIQKDDEITLLRAQHENELSQLRDRMAELERLVEKLADNGGEN